MSTTTTTNITTWIAQTTCTTRGCCGPAIQVSSGTNTTVLERADASDDNGRSTAAVSTRVVPAPTSLVIQELFQTVLHIPSNLSQLISAIWLHFSDQPKKPLWNIQQTVVMAFLQAFRDHSLTNSLEFWRLMLIFPTWLTPLTSKIQDGSFRVRPRNLRGILRQADKDEKAGTRVLEAEWMSAGTVWDRCQSIFSGKKKLEDFDLKEQEQILDICKHRNQGATALVLRARSPEKIVLYLHGGAYCAMSAQSHRTLTHKISKATDRRVFAINYRLAPETRFPGALYDAVQAYLHLIDNKDDGCSFEPGNILIMGDSAGGGLSLALMLYIRDHGLPQPEGAVLLSPWVDLTFSYPSWKEASVYDYLPSNPGLLKAMNPAYLYIGPNQPKEMVRHPYVSPIFAENFENLPPILIQSGGCESLRDEIQDLTEKIGATRTSLVHHEVYQDMVHVFQAFPFAKSAEAIESIGWWAKFGIPMIAQWQARGQLPSPSSSFAQQQQPSVPISRSQGRRFHSIPG